MRLFSLPCILVLRRSYTGAMTGSVYSFVLLVFVQSCFLATSSAQEELCAREKIRYHFPPFSFSPILLPYSIDLISTSTSRVGLYIHHHIQRECKKSLHVTGSICLSCRDSSGENSVQTWTGFVQIIISAVHHDNEEVWFLFLMNLIWYFWVYILMPSNSDCFCWVFVACSCLYINLQGVFDRCLYSDWPTPHNNAMAQIKGRQRHSSV